MGRRGRDDSDSISLFPFLSILACVIGVLTLMIAALTLSSIGSNPAVAQQEDQDRLERETKEDLAAVEELKTQIEKAESSSDDTQKKLAAARARLAVLQQQVLETNAARCTSARTSVYPES